MKSVLLIDIGAGPLPVVTPVPVAPSAWFPVLSTALPLPVPENITAKSVADGVLLEWDLAAPKGTAYVIERSLGYGGPYVEVGRTDALRFTYSEPDGVSAWFRVATTRNGRVSQYAGPILGVPSIANYSNRVSTVIVGAAARAFVLENGIEFFIADDDRPFMSEGGVPGQVVIDCKYSKFRVLLTEDITSVVFVNLSDSHELVWEVVQGGGHVIGFPYSVVPVAGTPYVPTPAPGAVDVIRLITFDAGITWRLIVDRAEGNPEAGGAVFAMTIAPDPASASSVTNGTTSTAPSVQVTATTANGTAPILMEWMRADAGLDPDFLVSDPASNAPFFSIPAGTTAYNATQTWRASAADAGNRVARGTVPITLSRLLEGLTATFNGRSASIYAVGTGGGPTGGVCQMVVSNDGTWTLYEIRTQDGITSPATIAASGRWHSGTAPSIGNDYEVVFNVSAGLKGTVTNGAPTFTALTASRSVRLEYTETTRNGSAARDISVSIRKASNHAESVTGSVAFTINIENS